MSMFKKVDTSLQFVEREKQVVEYWNENKIFEQSMQEREGGEEFSFYDGPPTANGKPHIGHILTRVMKDIVPRYQTMKGKHVLRKAGWDTHGLPVELEVEKKLGLESKTGIESYGIEPFIKQCKQSVWQYSTEWKKCPTALGIGAIWKIPTSPITTIISNQSGGRSKKFTKRDCFTKGIKSCLIVPVVERHFLHTK